MKKILIIKTSSLGDVIHGLPVASDIRRHFPDAHIDWVVEEPYAPLVALHPAVRRVIPAALRRWRRRLLAGATWKEIGEFRRLCKSESYDAIIDIQGLIKSAILGRAAQGPRHGFDADTTRERLAACSYDVTHHVAQGQHAVPRNRALVAMTLGFRVDEPVDYGIVAPRLAAPPVRRYCVLLHLTSRPEKLWSEVGWREIVRTLAARGLDCVLPWGSEEERRRSERIAQDIEYARVPLYEPIDRLADLLGGATAVVGVDTGLTHLAGALGRPVVGLYCASDPELNGVYGNPRAKNLGGPGIHPLPEEVLQALETLGAF